MTPSLLRVADPALWTDLERVSPLAEHTARALGPTERLMKPTFDRDVLPALARAGIEVSVRYARRTPIETASEQAALAQTVGALSRRAREVLHGAQRHAIDGWVTDWHAWDPEADRGAVRELLAAEILRAAGERYVLHPDLPPPPPIAYDFDEAVMPAPDDLSTPSAQAIALLHDLASLAAAIDAVAPKRTLAGTVSATDRRRLAQFLASPALATTALEEEPRWSRALRALEALQVVTMDGASRVLALDLGLDETLAGDTRDALDRLVHKLVDPDLHSALPAIRAALAAAAGQAIDEVVFLDLLHDQHRSILFAPWSRNGPVYPALDGEAVRRFDRDGFDAVEVPLIGRLLGRLERLGLVRRAPGVFAPTGDGRRWAAVDGVPLPPVWVSSDLEVMVPPGGVTPWERFQLERLGRCLGRDVVDRYKLERAGLVRWLRYHDLDEALALLRRRSPGVPQTAVETLTSWARSADRIVLVRGA